MVIDNLQALPRAFVERRDWGQFHTPKNLVMALSGEIGELTEIFQRLTPEESAAISGNRGASHRVEEEIADVLIYPLRLADVLDIDLEDAVRRKADANEAKYPVGQSEGRATKYTDLEAN
ncbi:nucleotide pyrophosphohydrolase [Rhodococcus sp. SJ-3]|uniref:nucleotide pyrophosphohydrolase n=1 Tax=Rhodococcus sp. SJ-3 TaxID=3454628 RepID=UPI003F799ABE